MTTSLPDPGQSGPDQHAAISRRFLEQAREELEAEDRLQASEKTWGAAAHALKAVAEERGWNHGHHALVVAVAEQLAEEFGRPEFNSLIGIAQSMHMNFYENHRGTNAVRQAVDDIEGFVDELERLRTVPPRPYVIRDTDARSRLRGLTGLRLELGDQSAIGFSQPDGSG